MRYIFFLSIFIFSNCKTNKIELTTISKYLYNVDSLKGAKIFVYQNLNDSTQFSYTTVSDIKINNKDYRSSVQSNGIMKFDSTISIKYKDIYMPYKKFMFEYDENGSFLKVTDVKVISNEIIDDGTKYGKLASSFTYEKDNIITKFESTLKYVKDTSIVLFSEQHKSILFNSNFNMDIIYSNFPLLNKKSDINGYSIYSENLGLTKYSMNLDEEVVEFELIEIR